MKLTTVQIEALATMERGAREGARKASRQFLEGLMAILVDSIDAFQDRTSESPEMALWEMLATEYAKVA